MLTYFRGAVGRRGGCYRFGVGSAVTGKGSFPAASARMSCRMRRFIDTLLSRPYRHHLSNASRSAAGRITLMRTIFSSFGVFAIRKTLDAPDALDNIRNCVYAVN